MIEQYAAGAAVSSAAVSLWWLLYRRSGCSPRLSSMFLGAIPISLAAIFIELAAFRVFSIFLSLVLISPAVEELLKFAASRYRTGTAAGVGTGLGFSLSENALYFGAFLQAHVSVVFLAGFLLMRSMTDPVLHSFTASTSVYTWQTRKLRFLGAAVLLHVLYNLMAFAGGSDLGLMLPAASSAALLMLAASLLSLRPSKAKQKEGVPATRSESYIRYEDGSRWCIKCNSDLPVGLNMAAHEHSEPHLSAVKARVEELLRAESHVGAGKVVLPSLGAAPDPMKDRDGFVEWLQKGTKETGFEAAAARLELRGEYAQAKWVRHSFYSSNKGRTHYWELGARMVILTVCSCTVVGFVLWMVFA